MKSKPSFYNIIRLGDSLIYFNFRLDSAGAIGYNDDEGWKYAISGIYMNLVKYFTEYKEDGHCV